MVTKRKIFLIILSLAVMALTLFGLDYYMKLPYSEKRINPVGLDYAKQECSKSNKYGKDVCSTLHVVGKLGDPTECYGKSCWIVYVSSLKDADFSADLVVVDEGGGKLVGREYNDDIKVR